MTRHKPSRPKHSTHTIRHRSGWVAEIFIGPTLQLQLSSSNNAVVYQARAKVCNRFREACIKLFPDFPPDLADWVQWHDLTIDPITRDATGAIISTGSVVIGKPRLARDCCGYDDCAKCASGLHGECRRGCMLD